ncbi:MAG: TOBE domain-containing protein [Solirubrobacteraceae bacterium]
MQISARNQLKGRIKSVSPGASIANIEIEVGDQRLVASITVEAADELELREGMEVTAVIKASDVIVGVGD